MSAIQFTAPIVEQRFVLDHVARIADLAATDRFAAAEPDMIDAILEGAAALAEGEWAPTNRTGDTVSPKWNDGEVTMPPGCQTARKRDPVSALKRDPLSGIERRVVGSALRCARRRSGVARPEARTAQVGFEDGVRVATNCGF
ncbi:acyl-CoA dehydrogenase N-terminal domain-containing protein [Sphingobium fuliginis]|uniref:acyl-CoA dehydrogenase N-terminal domain-containing protein n=1 Tax=Sphingobium fuliginis (strain ATCC 27551) TaxID=336203 RepID=UPI001ABF174E